ncbi:MAG: transporter associated domain-containing protein [Flavihumibacter sp.]
MSGKIPEADETITVGDFEFTVLEIDRNRIQKVKVTIRPM